MTPRRDLKRRVRARQAHTGESYMTFLRHVQALLITSHTGWRLPWAL